MKLSKRPAGFLVARIFAIMCLALSIDRLKYVPLSMPQGEPAWAWGYFPTLVIIPFLAAGYAWRNADGLPTSGQAQPSASWSPRTVLKMIVLIGALLIVLAQIGKVAVTLFASATEPESNLSSLNATLSRANLGQIVAVVAALVALPLAGRWGRRG